MISAVRSRLVRVVVLFAVVGQCEAAALVAKLRGHSATVYRAVFSPDGQYIVTASDDGSVALWQVRQ